MTLDRQEITQRLAHDYATRAKVLNLKFEDAYQRYYDRCSIRSLETLMEQFTCANLDRALKPNVPKTSWGEYIISASDDDCEDGVCKL